MSVKHEINTSKYEGEIKNILKASITKKAKNKNKMKIPNMTSSKFFLVIM